MMQMLLVVIMMGYVDGLWDIPKETSSKYVDTDIHLVKASNDSAFLCFYIEFNDSANLERLSDTTRYAGGAAISVYLDADFDSSTGLTWGWWYCGYDYVIVPNHTPKIEEPWQLDDSYGLHIYDQEFHPVYQFNRICDDCVISKINRNKVEFCVPLNKLNIKSDSLGVLVVTQERVDPWGGDTCPDSRLLGQHSLIFKFNKSLSHSIRIDGKFDDWEALPPLELSGPDEE